MDDIRRTVGGPPARIVEYSSDTREDVQLTVYHNKDGRDLGLEPHVLTDINHIPLFGPVVVIGTSDKGNVGLTDDEIAQVSIARHRDIPLPVLTFRAEDGSIFY
jgi:hypothetical protein